MRFPGKSIAVYIGRGNQYQGIFLSDKLPPSYLRVQDRLLDYARKYLVGSRIGKLETDNTSMISFFNFKNDHSDNTFLFGYKERQLFFAKKSKDEIYLSWNGENLHNQNLISVVKLFGADKAGTSLGQQVWSVEDYLKIEEKKIGGQPIQKKKEKFLTRKIKNISDDLLNVKCWIQIQDDLNNNKLNLDQGDIVVYGQKIKMTGFSTLWLRRDAVFKKIKKLKKAEEILSSRLKETSAECEKVKKGEFDFELTKEKVIQPLWITHQKNTKAQKSEGNIKNFKLNTLTGVVGLDAESNDWIRAHSSKDHFWFHIENYSGSHCVIKTDDFSRLSFNDLAAIGSMLRDFSKLEILEISLIYTQIKNIKGIKGSQGKVTVNKGKHLTSRYVSWIEIITII